MSTDSSSAASAFPVEREPLRARVSTIIWGVILLCVAALVLLGELGRLDELPNGALPIILVAVIGGLLVIGAVVGALSSAARRNGSPPTPGA
jgi:Na+/proline symporter